ncbi:molybdenum cofactor sulfurase-like [Impatiens glandulifera]|uniref:molybdenum cofactor sulfurase-like n=1 Tax=Impatiens glandulifera TaxID=253017 RepID=UPI001FB0CE0B|nr:molybdenum cofactor sulfurase-like [Impatiens glandulifera]
MQPPCLRDSSESCFSGSCFPATNLLNQSKHQEIKIDTPQHEFAAATAASLNPNTKFTNPDSLPSLPDSLSNFLKSYPKYIATQTADHIRDREYYHLTLSDHVCLDYVGQGLFSYSQLNTLQNRASSSSSSIPNLQFFNVLHKSKTHQGKQTQFEIRIQERIMKFMNISTEDYSMVFTANRSSAFKLVSEFYPFDSSSNLLTIYDHQSEAVDALTQAAKNKGCRIKTAKFGWPSLRIHTDKLKKMVISNSRRRTRTRTRTRTKGLFVFPLQSRMTGAQYSYQWMTLAHDNGWHVLLDASSLGAKDMETLGLSIFQPDFIICSFFKIFGENPSGFGCLFVKKTSFPSFNISTLSTTVKIANGEEEEEDENHEMEELEFRGLDHADNLGLILISSRVRYLVNWLVNALMSLEHPHQDDRIPLVRIYGPKIRVARGPAVAFNLFDWKGEKVEPLMVQKLADRSNISLSFGFILFEDQEEEEERERERGMEKKKKGFDAVTATLGFLTDFGDTYRVWKFVSQFLDADFVEKERWRYKALNQTILEV